jgi:hypothetical protein
MLKKDSVKCKIISSSIKIPLPIGSIPFIGHNQTQITGACKQLDL